MIPARELFTIPRGPKPFLSAKLFTMVGQVRVQYAKREILDTGERGGKNSYLCGGIFKGHEAQCTV